MSTVIVLKYISLRKYGLVPGRLSYIYGLLMTHALGGDEFHILSMDKMREWNM